MPDPISPIVALLRVVGLAEGISCVALFLVAMPLKHGFDMPLAVKIVGQLALT